MSKIDTLRSQRDFERVFTLGRKIINSGFVIYHLPSLETGIKVGICVGKSLANAVKRNRIKRRIREVIRKMDFSGDNRHIVIVARRSLLDKDFDYLSRSLKQALFKARLLWSIFSFIWLIYISFFQKEPLLYAGSYPPARNTPSKPLLSMVFLKGYIWVLDEFYVAILSAKADMILSLRTNFPSGGSFDNLNQRDINRIFR